MQELSRTTALLEAGIVDGLHVGAQLYASLRGPVAADIALGDARPGVGMRPDTLMLWMSSSKPVAAVAIAQLRERGVLDFDDAVARHIPEFAANGKESITIRHILTHTAGIRAVIGQWESDDWDETIGNISSGARIEPGWELGEKAGYHVATSWYILGEIVRRADGRPYRDYVREAIFTPLGMSDSWIGMPPDVYDGYGQRMGILADTSRGAATFATPGADKADALLCRPGAGGRGPMRELARLYEALLDGGRGVLQPESVRQLTTPQRIGLYDHTFRHEMDWGLGFIINSAKYGVETVPYGYGRHASEDTFGHSGSQSSCAFADPAHGLAVAIVWNGMPGEPKHQKRQRETLTALYEDLGLA
jgi:CubicO group peptidase (beta-lactamase class C family)